jgi:hypothetical protein
MGTLVGEMGTTVVGYFSLLRAVLIMLEMRTFAPLVESS